MAHDVYYVIPILLPSLESFRIGGFGPFDIFRIGYFGLILDLVFQIGIKEYVDTFDHI